MKVTEQYFNLLHMWKSCWVSLLQTGYVWQRELLHSKLEQHVGLLELFTVLLQ